MFYVHFMRSFYDKFYLVLGEGSQSMNTSGDKVISFDRLCFKVDNFLLLFKVDVTKDKFV
jgi:hypothetical protein